MTKIETEKENMIDALELGIALSRIYFDKLKYLYRNYQEEGDDEKEVEYFTQMMEVKSKIKTLNELKDQYK